MQRKQHLHVVKKIIVALNVKEAGKWLFLLSKFFYCSGKISNIVRSRKKYGSSFLLNTSILAPASEYI